MESAHSLRRRKQDDDPEMMEVEKMFEHLTSEHLSNHDGLIATLQNDVSEIHVVLARVATKDDISLLKDSIAAVETNILERIIDTGKNRISTWWIAVGSISMIFTAVWMAFH